jgi:hypothetical protein
MITIVEHIMPEMLNLGRVSTICENYVYRELRKEPGLCCTWSSLTIGTSLGIKLGKDSFCAIWNDKGRGRN